MLNFRNVDADPADPPASWPFEAKVTAVERGTLSDYRRIKDACDHDEELRREFLDVCDLLGNQGGRGAASRDRGALPGEPGTPGRYRHAASRRGRWPVPDPGGCSPRHECLAAQHLPVREGDAPGRYLPADTRPATTPLSL